MWRGFDLFRSGLSLVYGPPGAGKTSLAMSAAAALGRRVLYAGFYESTDRLVGKARALGLDPGAFHFLDFLSLEGGAALEVLMSRFGEVAPDVVVVDGVNALPTDREAAAALYRLFPTPVIAVGEESLVGSPLAYMADNVVEVRQYFLRGARYRVFRVVKTRAGPPPGVDFHFAITGRGVVVLRRWAQALEGRTVAVPSQRRVAFSQEVVEALARALPGYRRPGLLAGTRVASYICDHPDCLFMSAAFLCDYMDTSRVAVASTYPYIEPVAAAVGCAARARVVPVWRFAEEGAVEELAALEGDALFLYGAEEIYGAFGARRLAYVMDLLQTLRPDLALMVTFRGISPSPQLDALFNTVWIYERDRAVVHRSALGWPVRELAVERAGDRWLLKIK